MQYRSNRQSGRATQYAPPGKVEIGVRTTQPTGKAHD